jgi:WD40 repeat protein
LLVVFVVSQAAGAALSSYAPDLRAAQQALDAGKPDEARRLLQQHLPAAGASLRREFDWRYLWRQAQGTTNLPGTRDVTTGLVPRNPETRIIILPDNRTLAAASSNAYLQLYDLTTLAATNDIVAARDPLFLTSNGRTLLTSGDGGLQFWDIPAQALAPMWVFPQGGDWSLAAFSPTDWIAAARVGGGQVQLLDIGSSKPDKEISTFFAHQGTVRALVFSPDGKTLATAGTDKLIKLWNWAAQRTLATLTGHANTVTAVAFSPDGKTLASASQDRSVILWDAGSGTLKSRLEGHTGTVWTVVFAPDGQTLASASADNTIRFWNLAAAQPTITLDVPEKTSHGVLGLAFSPDGAVLAARLSDGTLRVWRAAPADPPSPALPQAKSSP